jgi:hypothetical protein
VAYFGTGYYMVFISGLILSAQQPHALGKMICIQTPSKRHAFKHQAVVYLVEICALGLVCVSLALPRPQPACANQQLPNWFMHVTSHMGQ